MINDVGYLNVFICLKPYWKFQDQPGKSEEESSQTVIIEGGFKYRVVFVLEMRINHDDKFLDITYYAVELLDVYQLEFI